MHIQIFVVKDPQEVPVGNEFDLGRFRAGFGHRPFPYAPDILRTERRTENRHDTVRNKIGFFIV